MSLGRRLAALRGKRLSEAALRELGARLDIPARLFELLTQYPLAGAQSSLAEDDDLSGLGAELQWMDDAELTSEAFEAYPGIVAVKLGYVPFGMCLEGSGDPYFVRTSDGAVVRIPHDAVVDDMLDEACVEEVAASLDELLRRVMFD